MDPNATLELIRAKCAETETVDSQDFGALCLELADLITGLDAWLSKGGFLPTDWQR